MKIIFKSFILLLFALLLLLTQQEAKADGCASPCNGSGWSYGATETVELPGYSGCSVTFTYNFRTCIIGDQKYSEIDITSFRVVTNWNDSCARLQDSILNDTLGTWEFTNWVFHQGYFEICVKHFMELYQAASIDDKWKFECPEIYIKYESLWKSCAQIVFYKNMDPVPNQDELIVVYAPCDDKICCIHMLEICWDTIKDELFINETMNYDSGECDMDPEEHPGAFYESDCLQLCVEME